MSETHPINMNMFCNPMLAIQGEIVKGTQMEKALRKNAMPVNASPVICCEKN